MGVQIESYEASLLKKLKSGVGGAHYGKSSRIYKNTQNLEKDLELW